eukprot:7062494-Prymnesium_polylepis.1
MQVEVPRSVPRCNWTSPTRALNGNLTVLQVVQRYIEQRFDRLGPTVEVDEALVLSAHERCTLANSRRLANASWTQQDENTTGSAELAAVEQAWRARGRANAPELRLARVQARYKTAVAAGCPPIPAGWEDSCIIGGSPNACAWHGDMPLHARGWLRQYAAFAPSIHGTSLL